MAWDSSHMGLGFRTSRLEGQLVGKHMLGFREELHRGGHMDDIGVYICVYIGVVWLFCWGMNAVMQVPIKDSMEAWKMTCRPGPT